MDKSKLKSLLVAPSTSIREAMQRLSETAERILFVDGGEGRLIGTLTDGDIRNGIIKGLGLDTAVSEVMNRNFRWVDAVYADFMEQAKALMLSHKIEQVPLLKDGVIIDVILWIDLFGEIETAPRELLPNKVVIMAGGKGTRLAPFTNILPKPLIPIGDKPIIEIIMQRFHRAGFHDFLFTLNYKKEYIKMFLKESGFHYKIDWVEEDEFMGTAGSLSLIEDRLTDTFFVSNCDIVLDADFKDVLKWHKKNGALMTVVGCHKEMKIPYGILNIEDGYLKGMTEKPGFDFLINTGVYVMEPEAIKLIGKRHMDMNTLIELAMKAGKVSVYPIHEGWFDTGQWEEYRLTLDKLEGII